MLKGSESEVSVVSVLFMFCFLFVVEGENEDIGVQMQGLLYPVCVLLALSISPRKFSS